jgi:hypothetical protein
MAGSGHNDPTLAGLNLPLLAIPFMIQNSTTHSGAKVFS